MFYDVTGSDDEGWLIVFYAQKVSGWKTVFEVSQQRYATEQDARQVGSKRLTELVAAANSIWGSFA